MRVKLTRTVTIEAEISPEHLVGTKQLTVEQAITRINSGVIDDYSAQHYLTSNGWGIHRSDVTTAEIVDTDAAEEQAANEADATSDQVTGDGGDVIPEYAA